MSAKCNIAMTTYSICIRLQQCFYISSVSLRATQTKAKAQTMLGSAKKCNMKSKQKASWMHRPHGAIWDGKCCRTKVYDITFTIEKGRVKITNGKYGALENPRGTGKVNHKWIISFGTAAGAGVERSVYHSAAPRWRY